MAYNITLSSSMRSNLLSLRNIATQMSRTQNILSTGKKINSAIDNATSYYQARSLTNRASDLNSLLDSMSQGIQTIQTASTGLERATSFLDQATVIAYQAYETEIIKVDHNIKWFIDNVGSNGAVVTTAQELKDAINSNKEMICIYGTIDYFDGENIELKDGQKLVGTEYFTGFTCNENRFSALNTSGQIHVASGNTAEISDLTVQTVTQDIYGIFNQGTLTIRNATIHNTLEKASQRTGLFNVSNLFLEGKIDITTTNMQRPNNSAIAIYNSGGNLSINENCEINLAINCNAKDEKGSIFINYGTANIGKDSVINITGINNNTYAIICGYSTVSSLQTMNIESGVKINAQNCYSILRGGPSGSGQASYINIAKDVELSAENNGVIKSWILSNDYTFNFSSGFTEITPSALDNNSNFSKQEKEVLFDHLYEYDENNENDEEYDFSKQYEQYQNILTEFNNLLMDSSYQGVNLLTGGELKVTFNEARTHHLSVKGKDMRSDKIGINDKKWKNKDDIKVSIKEILDATSLIRNYVAELGNKYTIIQNRQSFTEALTDILEVGADKLTLADMNETSTEYLMLQTRQQLAVNSLSLASQSAKAILSLF